MKSFLKALKFTFFILLAGGILVGVYYLFLNSLLRSPGWFPIILFGWVYFLVSTSIYGLLYKK